MGEYVYQGDITLSGDKVELNFLDRREQKLFDIIGVGERGYTPADGKEYIDAMIMAFSRSTAISISIKKEKSQGTNASEQIIAKQAEWANNKGLELIGSAGDRGRKVYTTNIEDNLFQPLNDKTRKELEGGDGGELKGKTGQPAKMQALHSSSALGINVFDYWRDSSDVTLLFSTCGLSRAKGQLSGEVQFEQKFSIDDRFQFSPNLDVVFYPSQPHKCKAFAIECKFTEAYSSHKHGGVDRKYFTNDKIWENLSTLKHLSDDISPDDNRFEHLHAAQLIKHILGLNRKFGHSRYRILYLWYDALGGAGFKHRKEVNEFSKIALSDGVLFHAITYQELIVSLAKHREQHNKYIEYLTARYL
jgi:hypothetical protein